jgi:hypothetical protein
MAQPTQHTTVWLSQLNIGSGLNVVVIRQALRCSTMPAASQPPAASNLVVCSQQPPVGPRPILHARMHALFATHCCTHCPSTIADSRAAASHYCCLIRLFL